MREAPEWDLVWLTRRCASSVPRGIRAVSSRLRMAYELATAQVLISNTRMGKYFDKGYIKKDGQVYIQTWHGSFGIKKMEGDCTSLSATYVRRAKKDSHNIDYLISNSRWLTKVYRSSFYYSGQIVECGSPRNDLLFAPTEKAVEVREKLGIPTDVRLVMYAPTFRQGAMNSYERLDYKEVTDALNSRFGGEWRVLVRVHPGYLGQQMHGMVESGMVQDVSAYPDMTELLATADVLISDYSSCLFDFLLTGRPSFIYAPDIEEYGKERGLYYSLSDSPSPLALSNNDLGAQIRCFNEHRYEERTKAFLNDKGSVEDGHAAERVVSLIRKAAISGRRGA